MLQNTVQYGKVSEARLLPDILTSFSLNFPVLMHQGIYFSKYFFIQDLSTNAGDIILQLQRF